MKNQNGFTLVEGLLIVLVVSVIGFAGYSVWNNSQDNEVVTDSSQISIDSNEEAEQQPEASEETEAAKAEPVEATNEVFTSGYRNESTGILVDFLITEGHTAYWVEYGQTPDNLSEKTASLSQGLGYDFEGGYGGGSAVIDPTTLPAGDNIYFYRVAATKNGQTNYTGISSFNYK